MMPNAPIPTRPLDADRPSRSRVDEIVIVAPACDRFADFVAAGHRGEVGVHFCVDGRSALRMSRRFRADVWLVAATLPDMSGFDLVEMLLPSVARATMEPLLAGTAGSRDRIGAGLRTAVVVVAENYSFVDEERALRAGAAGYVAGSMTLDLLRDARQCRHAGYRGERSQPDVVMGGAARHPHADRLPPSRPRGS
jgi:CheY-like chemotaxis protein